MAIVKLPPDFKEFLKLLNDNGVRYLLVGGYAVAYHGYPRSTADMDIWIEVDPSNASKLVDALKEFGFSSPDLSVDLFLEKEKVIRMGVPPIRIEILTSISGVMFEECFQSRITDELDGIDVNLISLPHLKVNKEASGRHKDLDDLENLP
jgi:predicted nucleotidyltransferase